MFILARSQTFTERGIFDGRHKPLGSTQGTRPHQLRQIQILWNDLNVGCFYLINPPSRQQYFQLLKKANNPPQELKFISVFFRWRISFKAQLPTTMFFKFTRIFLS